ncbi:MAG: tRNA pseudouridine(38-40) synthase TruA [Acidimicrobiales bacterium]
MRVRLTVAYDGREFRGFAPNAGVPTVGGALADAIERVLRHPVELTCAGRTDAGVHARGQVVTFDAASEALDLDGLARSLNAMLGPAIAVRDTAAVGSGFDARRSARSRVYRYTVLNTPWPDPFWAGHAWHVPPPLDLDLLRLGCDPLIGEHDFASFCRRPADDVTLVRRVSEARWEDAGDGVLHFWIEANAFCHQMVRSLVGTLVEIGLGKKRAGEMRSILQARDRHAAGQLAPPDGLSLWDVRY